MFSVYMHACSITASLVKTVTTQKMKFSFKYFFRKCDQTAVLITFTEDILNGKLHFLRSELILKKEWIHVNFEVGL